MNERCGNCKFWREGAGGRCRRRAPSPPGKVNTTLWPKVQLNEWCGEWEAKGPAQAPNTLGDVMGRWPGDESEQELLEGLAELDGKEIVPLSFTMDIPSQGEVTKSFVPGVGRFRVRGIKSFTESQSVKILRISIGDSEHNLIAGPIDAASYECGNSRDYWEADWGFISKEKPLCVTATAFGNPAYCAPLSFVLYGEAYDDNDRSEPKTGPDDD